MKYTVVLTDTAKQDLRDIAFWIAVQSKGVAIAKHFVNELREECHPLDMFPNSGALPKDRILKSLGYRFTVHKEYLIFYRVDEEKRVVNIVAIYNAKKDYMHVMKKFI